MARVTVETEAPDSPETDLVLRLSQRITAAREQAGISQAELAAQLGVDNTAISKIEQGKRNVSSVELALLAEYCGKALSWFFEESVDTAVPHFRGVEGSNSQFRRDVAKLAELADTYVFLEAQLEDRRA